MRANPKQQIRQIDLASADLTATPQIVSTPTEGPTSHHWNETPRQNLPADIDEQLMNEDENLVHQDEPTPISNVEFSAKSVIALRGDLPQVRLSALESNQLQVWRLRLCNV